MFRTEELRHKIVSNISQPYCVENFISPEEIQYLIELYDNWPDKIYKNPERSGPVTTVLKDLFDSDPILSKIKGRIINIFGNVKLEMGLHFNVTKPHIIHNDDFRHKPDSIIYKAITLPLRIEYNEDVINKQTPFLCMFDQYYLEGPAKFFKSQFSRDKSYYNTPIHDYSEINNKSEESFPEDIRLKYFTHLNPTWLEGLSFNSAHPWIPGNAIIFDCVRLHAASDFTTLGIKSKLGISIFTTLL